MTTQEIQEYIDAAIQNKFGDVTSESGEMMTSEGGDGRFFGKVIATRYGGLPQGGIFLAIGETDQGVQIVKLGKTEGLNPEKENLDMFLLKELGVE